MSNDETPKCPKCNSHRHQEHPAPVVTDAGAQSAAPALFAECEALHDENTQLRNENVQLRLQLEAALTTKGEAL